MFSSPFFSFTHSFSSLFIGVGTTTQRNTKCLEKIFKTDIFYLFYLRHNPKAYKVLQKQLSAIGCTIELDFEEEEAVVTGDIEKGPGGAFDGAAENWKLKVDQIFIDLIEAYSCHHVLEPEQVKRVLQDPFFETDDVKVYSETGYAVMVGEVEMVKEKIAVLEKSIPIRKEQQVVQKQFKLIAEEFNREMRAHHPEVKILSGGNTVILEGPEEKVQSGAAKLNELIKKIKEKRVNLSTDLLTFMATSSVISKYETRFQQSLRSPVSLEVGLELILSSLSSEALEEAETAVLRDLSVSSENLQGAAAVPPDLDRLKEILIKAKNQANQGDLRVEVSFVPGSSGSQSIKVQLVGYTEHVNKLKELLQDYQSNQVSTQEVLNLQPPELVDSFDKVLRIFNMKQTDVTLRTSHFPNPCVVLSGPRVRVQETKQALMSTLASMTLDTLTLDGPGALRYFQGDGKESKELVESSCQALTKGLKRCLDLCVEKGFSSVAIPVIGPGLLLKYPMSDAVQALTENIRQFALSAQCEYLTTIHIIIKPGYPDSEEVPSRQAIKFQQIKDVNDAKKKLKNQYKLQCSDQTFPKEDLQSLTGDDMQDLQQMVELEGLYMKKDSFGNLMVNGMKDGVNRAILKFNSYLHGNLRREVRGREENDLYIRVMWCILGKNGNWDRLPKTPNYNLEKRDVAGGIVDAQGVTWQVDLLKLEVTSPGQKTLIKRLENLEGEKGRF
ncbi:hypothetical protein XENOCAPTIV_004795 [Xenoophorus captivus]|uniref:Macro domain-containing protein n=1 Tax=Xenoophorus captivus TaxID=1517983 RepID=A0ABV0R6Y7_9TELE